MPFLTALAVGFAIPGATTDNFIGSCDASSVKVSGRVITANCKNILGQLKCSRLDLNKCIKNSYGRLQADPTGSAPGFGDQCIECSNGKTTDGLLLGNSPTLLHCKCNPGTGAAQANWPTAIIDLNTIVDNSNGLLECYKAKGTPC
ncbi:hypothetical protein B0T21DRAFT_411996 [Apiosordaria backusii]|uniref:Cyanovirin-N domain-containing protein n=1 Tax=Apiosordaria backusii TaxID=314023 RepID=A0AA40EH16_9PEZI|nr:hypothetical protein B0T21DRAFT_411996 [Apiosordaria backusii]